MGNDRNITDAIMPGDPYFISFKNLSETQPIPQKFEMMEQGEPHMLCMLAAQQLQQYLVNAATFHHNFGLSNNNKGKVIGKMFGVLVVKNANNELGYLAAFSGKLGGRNIYPGFVPPIFDGLEADGFLNKGMEELSRMTEALAVLDLAEPKPIDEITALKKQRRKHSVALQQRLFENYHILNKAGHEKNLKVIFKEAGYNNPPAGAGECAGPKLLQYAFKHSLQPLTLAEFWWGQSPKSATWKHGAFYPCCKEKCAPILAHMLLEINGNELKGKS